MVDLKFRSHKLLSILTIQSTHSISMYHTHRNTISSSELSRNRAEKHDESRFMIRKSIQHSSNHNKTCTTTVNQKNNRN
uniref:Uncharacterized protein n=1 Tax=Manihot esculenta TaxID=3983 RepID=A0A199UBJ9_MANES